MPISNVWDDRAIDYRANPKTQPKTTNMKKATLIARVLAIAGLLVTGYHYLQPKDQRDPLFFYLACGLIGLAWLLTVIAYAVTRNKKDLRELLLFTGLIAAGYLAFYFS